jgi:hypothetical protein
MEKLEEELEEERMRGLRDMLVEGVEMGLLREEN